MAYLRAKISIYPAQKAEMSLLLAKEVSVLKEYIDFSSVFFKKSATVLPNCFNINKYAIDLKLGKQPPYELIDSVSLVELETLKTYIETNLASKFI